MNEGGGEENKECSDEICKSKCAQNSFWFQGEQIFPLYRSKMVCAIRQKGNVI